MYTCDVCNVKMANVQSETSNIDPKVFQIKFRSWLSIGVITFMILDYVHRLWTHRDVHEF